MKYKYILNGVICGSTASIIINLSLVLFLFIESEIFFIVSFLPALFYCTLVIALLKSASWRPFIVSVISALISFLTTEIILSNIGIMMHFYRLQYGDVEMHRVFGVIAVAYYVTYFIFAAIGTIIACILTSMKIIKSNTDV